MALHMDMHDIEDGVEATSADAAQAVHREAHGLVADAIYEVVQG